MKKLRPAARLRWGVVENLHITTKFIGEWPENRLGELTAALRGLPGREAIPVAVRGLGWFPNPHAPRVLWAAVHAGPELAELAAQTEAALEKLGVARENRRFAPHLTLARIRPPDRIEDLRRIIASSPSLEFGAFQVDRYYLYRSDRGPSGSVYTRLEEFPLLTRV